MEQELAVVDDGDSDGYDDSDEVNSDDNRCATRDQTYLKKSVRQV